MPTAFVQARATRGPKMKRRKHVRIAADQPHHTVRESEGEADESDEEDADADAEVEEDDDMIEDDSFVSIVLFSFPPAVAFPPKNCR